MALHIKGVYWHIFPTYSEAKQAIWIDPHMLAETIPEGAIAKRNEADLSIFFKNGSIYQLKGQDNPDSLRGANPIGGVSDEYDLHDKETWGIIEPIIRANGGFWWFIGTPKGRGKLYDAYMKGQRHEPDWWSKKITVTDTTIYSSEELEKARKSMGQRMFSQELMCDFLENEGSVFRGVREAMTSEPETPQIGHIYVIGCDLAKVTDYTVLTVYDRLTNAQVFQDRFKTLEWPYQKAKIAAIAKHYNNALIIIDGTGIGDPIADDLTRIGLAIEPFKITEQSKKDLIEKLSIWIEQRKIRLLPIDDTLIEFDNFSYDIGPTGKIRYGARQGYHDDIVLAHALAAQALAPLVPSARLDKQNTLQKYYHWIKQGKQAPTDYEEWNG